MSFLSPWFLLLLLPLAALVVATVLLRRRRERYAVRFASLPLLDRVVPERPAWRRHLTGGLMLLTLVLLGTAAARPEVDVRVPRERATVVVAIDTSTSMQARDVEPNRMQAATQAAARFVDELPEDVNVGLVSFAGSASVISSPTTEHESVKEALTGLRTADSTAIGEAVFTSLDQVAALARQVTGDEQVPAHVVLLSDGTNTAGRTPEEAAAAAVEARVPVSTIAYGTPEGVVEDGEGRQIPVPVGEEALARLAEQTGGTPYTAANSEELRAVYDDIGSLIGWRTEPRELTPYLAALAFLLSLTAAALSLRWFARLV